MEEVPGRARTPESGPATEMVWERAVTAELVVTSIGQAGVSRGPVRSIARSPPTRARRCARAFKARSLLNAWSRRQECVQDCVSCGPWTLLSVSTSKRCALRQSGASSQAPGWGSRFRCSSESRSDSGFIDRDFALRVRSPGCIFQVLSSSRSRIPSHVEAGQGQSTTLRGVIVARATGQPIADATVTVEGSTVGAKTNGLGRFELSQPSVVCRACRARGGFPRPACSHRAVARAADHRARTRHRTSSRPFR